jgi:GTP cyclohydrolase I
VTRAAREAERRPDVAALRRFLRSLGVDPARDPEYAGTAGLVAAFLKERTAGLRAPARPLRALRYRGRPGAAVALERIPIYGLCPHHLVPYFGAASVRYMPRDRVAGAGSLARVVRDLTMAPRLQEDLTEAVADAIDRALAPRSVEVRIAARHFCLEMRGAEQRAALVTEARRGEALDAERPAAPRSGRAARTGAPRARARRPTRRPGSRHPAARGAGRRTRR